MTVMTNSTSRQVVGTSNTPQKYTYSPIPADVNLLSVYLHSEFNNLSTTLSDILGGQILPILADMPEKYKEGTLILFDDKVVDKNGVTVIPSAGLYLFFKGVWNSIAITPVNVEG